jgi:hypothetical protein
VSVDAWPDDFQQLLQDLVDVDILPGTSIPTYMLPIAPHFEEWDELCHPSEIGDCWTKADFEKAEEFLRAMAAGAQFPPLIVDSECGLLRDGYHRLYAIRQLGLAEYPMILLDTIL